MKNLADDVNASCSVVASCVTQRIAGQTSYFSTFLAGRVMGERGEVVLFLLEVSWVQRLC